MAISYQDITSSSDSVFACAVRRCVGVLQPPSPSDVDPVLVSSCSPGVEPTVLTDVHSVSSPPSSAPVSLGGDLNDVASRGVPTSGMMQLKAGLARVYQLVTALVSQVTVIASDVVSLKDRITAVEGTQTPALLHGQETQALAQQVNELRECVAFQEDRIAVLERSQRAESESYRKAIQELTTKLDNIRVVDHKKTPDDTVENLCQSFKTFQQSMECQAARITGVKADTARKIALLQSEMTGVQTELSAVKTVALPPNVLSAGQAAREARKARILASVAERMEAAALAEEIEKLCPLPPVVTRGSACTTVCQDEHAALASAGGPPIILPSHSKTEGTTVKNLDFTKAPLTTARANATQPGADKIPAMPTIPLPPIPTDRLIPAKGSGKENKPYGNSTKTMLQYTQMFQPVTGRSRGIDDKHPTASPKKVPRNAEIHSKISAIPQPRKSMLPAPRKSQLPSVAQRAAIVDSSSSKEVKTADRFTRAETQPKVVKHAPISTFRSSSDPTLPRMVEKKSRAVLPASSSLATLDAALQAMQLDDDLLAPVPALNCSIDDSNLSAMIPNPLKAKRNRSDKYAGTDISLKQRVDVKSSRSVLKSRLAGSEVSPTSSSIKDENDALTLSQMDLFSRVMLFLPREKPDYKGRSLYVSPIRASVKPSRRL